MHLEYDATEITTHTCQNNNLFFVVIYILPLRVSLLLAQSFLKHAASLILHLLNIMLFACVEALLLVVI